MNRFGNVDSKFRFVILASKRAKQLLKGAKPKVKSKTKNPIRIAQSEVRAGVIEYEILPIGKDEIIEQDDRIFVGEGIHEEVCEVEEEAPDKDLLPLETGAVDEVVEDSEEHEEDEDSEAEDEDSGDSDEDKDN